jgi:HEPN domain-containing protein
LVKKIVTREVTEAEARIFLDKALDCVESAQEALGKRKWDRASREAVQGAIFSVDAILGARYKVRSGGQDHTQAATLLSQKVGTEDARKNAARFIKIINKKNVVQYEGRHASEAEARSLVRDAERLLDWVKPEIAGI